MRSAIGRQFAIAWFVHGSDRTSTTALQPQQHRVLCKSELHSHSSSVPFLLTCQRKFGLLLTEPHLFLYLKSPLKIFHRNPKLSTSSTAALAPLAVSVVQAKPDWASPISPANWLCRSRSSTMTRIWMDTRCFLALCSRAV